MSVDTFGEASPQRRRLAAALRDLRRQAGLSGEALGAALGVSQSKVSRLERGQGLPEPAEAEAWAAATGASADQRAQLAELVEAAAVETVAFRRRIREGLVALQAETAELEASAGLLRVFQPVLVPGLLQTPPYARAVYEAAHPNGRSDIAEAVAARMNRQAILYEPAKRFEFVVSEAGLRWQLGPREVLLGQLDRLGTVASLPNVTLGIVPLAGTAPVWHTHGFVIFDDRDAEPVVHVETLTSALNVRSPDDVARYQEAFARLRDAALTGAEARNFLEAIVQDEGRR